jgi:hypothetical protein
MFTKPNPDRTIKTKQLISDEVLDSMAAIFCPESVTKLPPVNNESSF